MNAITRMAVILILAGMLLFSACSSYTPYDYKSGRETKPGPGLFSGENGAFTIYRKQDEPEKQENGKKQIFEKPATDEHPAEYRLSDN